MASVCPTPLKCHEATALALAGCVIVAIIKENTLEVEAEGDGASRTSLKGSSTRTVSSLRCAQPMIYDLTASGSNMWLAVFVLGSSAPSVDAASAAAADEWHNELHDEHNVHARVYLRELAHEAAQDRTLKEGHIRAVDAARAQLGEDGGDVGAEGEGVEGDLEDVLEADDGGGYAAEDVVHEGGGEEGHACGGLGEAEQGSEACAGGVGAASAFELLNGPVEAERPTGTASAERSTWPARHSAATTGGGALLGRSMRVRTASAQKR
ncbi:hypothetical protein K438DRAFT_1965544 [Mycena galopus ATCC 62051]|nr:hypothetical protein K438DRAFT_1965544 [Mycena galopus ATCC 62051]